MSNMKIGYVGFGKMGKAMALRLKRRGWTVSVYHRQPRKIKATVPSGVTVVSDFKQLVDLQAKPALIWLMVPHKAVDQVLVELVPHLSAGDTVVDGGNSFYEDSVRRAGELKKLKINFLDAGVSGGPGGAKAGACLMVGGEKKIFSRLEDLFKALSASEGYLYTGPSGSGHFVKMVHNGIEYGMMQALAEGFAVMKESKYKLDLKKIAELYNHGSVIESRLVGWLADGFEKFGLSLSKASGSVDHTGEGKWTVETAKKLKIPVPIIEGSFRFRVASEKKPSYTGRILTVLRHGFGGHDLKKKS